MNLSEKLLKITRSTDFQLQSEFQSAAQSGNLMQWIRKNPEIWVNISRSGATAFELGIEIKKRHSAVFQLGAE